MSLAWRILLTVLLLNLAVVGGIQLVSYLHQERRLQEGQEQYIDDVLSVLPILSTLQDVYSPERLAGAGLQVRELIRSESLLGPFVDGMVTSGRPPFEGLVHIVYWMSAAVPRQAEMHAAVVQFLAKHLAA